MYPATILGYSLIWYDSFTRYTTDPSKGPFQQWDAIEAPPNTDNLEQQHYKTDGDLTYINSYDPSAIMPDTPKDQLFITPQRRSDDPNSFESARFHGKTAHACPEGKSMILQAEIQLGNAPSDKQGGVWPAFWALGESFKTGTKWPLCGEWDILETSDNHGWSLATLRWGKTVDGGVQLRDFWTSDYKKRQHMFDTSKSHTWALKVDRTSSNWEDQTLQWLMDGEKFAEAKGSQVGDEETWKVVAHQAYFPVLNVAVGSNFPEAGKPSKDTATGLDAGMMVDYVAFYVSD